MTDLARWRPGRTPASIAAGSGAGARKPKYSTPRRHYHDSLEDVSVVALVEGVMDTMSHVNLKVAVAALLVLAALGSGSVAQREREKQPDVAGGVAEVSKDGKTITVVIPPKERGDEPTKTEVK